eukprot:scaffold229173_cov19-Tisochrysis_lutea.AAC.1
MPGATRPSPFFFPVFSVIAFPVNCCPPYLPCAGTECCQALLQACKAVKYISCRLGTPYGWARGESWVVALCEVTCPEGAINTMLNQKAFYIRSSM